MGKLYKKLSIEFNITEEEASELETWDIDRMRDRKFVYENCEEAINEFLSEKELVDDCVVVKDLDEIDDSMFYYYDNKGLYDVYEEEMNKLLEKKNLHIKYEAVLEKYQIKIRRKMEE